MGRKPLRGIEQEMSLTKESPTTCFIDDVPCIGINFEI